MLILALCSSLCLCSSFLLSFSVLCFFSVLDSFAMYSSSLWSYCRLFVVLLCVHVLVHGFSFSCVFSVLMSSSRLPDRFACKCTCCSSWTLWLACVPPATTSRSRSKISSRPRSKWPALPFVSSARRTERSVFVGAFFDLMFLAGFVFPQFKWRKRGMAQRSQRNSQQAQDREENEGTELKKENKVLIRHLIEEPWNLLHECFYIPRFHLGTRTMAFCTRHHAV